MATVDVRVDCDARGHRFRRENLFLCIRCGHMMAPDGVQVSPMILPVILDPDLTRCARRLRPEWEARCSRPASVNRAGIRFCHLHDPGAGVTTSQAAMWAELHTRVKTRDGRRE